MKKFDTFEEDSLINLLAQHHFINEKMKIQRIWSEFMEYGS